MSGLERRLDALEARAGDGGRCRTCRDWPGYRVVYPADYAGVEAQTEQEQPTRCPDCAWEPSLIQIVYVSGAAWRESRPEGR